MISEPLVRSVLLVEAVVAVAACVVVVGHGLWLGWWHRREAARLARGRAWLAGRLAAPPGDEGDDGGGPVPRLPRRVKVRLFEEIGPSVAGGQGEVVSRLAEDLGLTARARRMCRSRLWWRRLVGAHRLTVYHAGLPAPLLDDRHPAVRAQAAEWVADHRVGPLVPRLVAMLGDPEPLCRHAARDAVLRCGSLAVPPLVDLLARAGPGDPLVPALEVAAWRPHPAYGEAALRLATNAEPAVRARAASLLGALGGEGATGILASLLADPDAGVRAGAADALGRLGYWPAGPTLAGLLDDPDWATRQAAARALSHLGAPGMLLLRRRAAEEGDAGLIARQALDLAALRDPATAGRT